MRNLNYSEKPDSGRAHYKPVLEAAKISRLNPELFNLTMSQESLPLLEAVKNILRRMWIRSLRSFTN